MNDELRGVAGWLLVFVIIMAVISPLISAVMVYRELYTGEAAMLAGIPMFESLRTVGWAMVAFDALIGWFVAWRLVAVHNWLSVQFAIAAIWFAAVAGTVGTIFALTAITGASAGDVLAASGPGGADQALHLLPDLDELSAEVRAPRQHLSRRRGPGRGLRIGLPPVPPRV